MQVLPFSPADGLLQRLHHSDRIKTHYAVLVEKNHHYTNVIVMPLNANVGKRQLAITV